MKKLEHIPFITFEGEISNPKNTESLFEHMHIPVGKLTFTPFGSATGKVYDGKEWKRDNPLENNPHEIETVGDLWGIKNFAMARLMTKEQLKNYSSVDPEALKPAPLYLQLRHSPNLTYPTPKTNPDNRYYDLRMPAFESIIPLSEQEIEQIKNHLYTSRIEIRRGHLKRYGAGNSADGMKAPLFPEVPDGTYEFFHGVPEKVGFQGMTTRLAKDHPLYKLNNQQIQELFNMGMTMHAGMSRDTFYRYYYPHRYAYFRNGDLYIMGAKIFDRNNPALIRYAQSEKEKASRSSKKTPYLPFVDDGPPLLDGKFDIEKIETFGLKVPEKHYLVLGDNHAMSADSRVFGFVPQENLEGAPSLILWPLGDRWGAPPQTCYPTFVVPRLVIWTIAAIIFAIWYAWHRKKMNTRLFPHDNVDR
jgi:signal peptidase I